MEVIFDRIIRREMRTAAGFSVATTLGVDGRDSVYVIHHEVKLPVALNCAAMSVPASSELVMGASAFAVEVSAPGPGSVNRGVARTASPG